MFGSSSQVDRCATLKSWPTWGTEGLERNPIEQHQEKRGRRGIFRVITIID